jgi:hypothetical protein
MLMMVFADDNGNRMILKGKDGAGGFCWANLLEDCPLSAAPAMGLRGPSLRRFETLRM